MRKLSVLLAALLLLALAVAPTFAQGSIVDVAASVSDFSTLVAAVQAADPSIAEALSTGGPFTVFAPTNAAFARLLATYDLTLGDLVGNQELLNQVLLYHVVAGAVPASTVATLDGQTVPTLLPGAGIGITIENGTVVLNGVVEVIQTDVQASNGIIHVINDVLLPGSVVAALGEPPQFANVRVAHFSPDTPAVDIYVNGAAAITGLEFGTITDWVTLPPGSYEVAVAPAGTSLEEAAIGPATLTFGDNQFVTVAAIGSLANGTLRPAIIAENLSGVASDSARVTVFHAIEDAPAVDVRAGDTRIIRQLGFPGSLGDNDGVVTIEVPAGSYDLNVVPSGATEPVVIDLSGTELAADTYYFVAAIGTLAEPQVALAATSSEQARELRRGGAAAAEEEAAAPAGTIAEIVAGNPDFSILLAAVQAADPAVLEALSGEGPLTVFAPTNDAFTALLERLGVTADAVLADSAAVTNVLLYHVISGAVLAADVVGLDGQSVPTLLGPEISIAVVDGGVVLNGNINVVQTDIIASNGVIHVIDGVLLPPTQ
ncbi:MAG: fasciclin domain-containing protein [Chloroflexi bacterium]|nr:fasciclin domain-containing protein [Chloroflexota bacterium]